MRQEINAFQQRLSQAEALAITDRLTGIANRAEGERRLEEGIRSGERLCILLFDLDDFKIVNDRFGHQAGDLVLRTFAQRLAHSVRPTDTVCRWGGDEFLAILPGCGLRDAMARAEELGEKCSGEYEISHDGRRLKIRVRASIGTAEHKEGESSEAFFQRADKFLYREKETGLLEVIGADHGN